jgi:hypothetical protein
LITWDVILSIVASDDCSHHNDAFNWTGLDNFHSELSAEGHCLRKQYGLEIIKLSLVC